MSPIYKSIQRLYGVQAGYDVLTSNSAGAGDKISFSVTGDGRTPLELYASAKIASDTITAGTEVYVVVRDGSAGTGTAYAISYYMVPAGGAANLRSFHTPIGVVGPWSGAKTFYLNLQNGAGTPTMYGAESKCWMRAVWAPGLTATNPL